MYNIVKCLTKIQFIKYQTQFLKVNGQFLNFKNIVENFIFQYFTINILKIKVFCKILYKTLQNYKTTY